MSTAFNNPPVIPADFRRDHWDRPIIRLDGLDVAYTRASKAAKTIEDTYNLELWARRNVSFGMTYDPSLVARMLAIGGDPSTWSDEDKRAVNTIVGDAETVAKARKAADIGIAVHRLTERADRGEDVDAGPYGADLDAYRQCLDDNGLEPVHVECRIVNDALKMAGTADRIMRKRRTGQWVIGDIKTSATVDFGGLGWCAQLAAYASGELYDAEHEVRLPTPDIDRAVGYIIHLPAGQGRCSLYEADLVAGYRAAELANEIRDVRRASARWLSVVADRRQALRDRFNALDADGQAVYRSRHADADDLDDVEAAIKVAEGKRPTGTLIVLAERRMAADAERQASRDQHPAGGPVDEGPAADADDVDDVKERYDGLTGEQQMWTGKIVTEAIATGHDFRISTRSSQRRLDLYGALVAWAESPYWDDDGDNTVHDDYGFRSALHTVCGDPSVFWPTLGVGEIVGRLTAGEARHLRDLVASITADDARLSIDDNGLGEWTVQANHKKENQT